MAFFDKLNDLAKNLGEKTSDAIETTKLSSRVGAERAAAGEELKKIGEFYYAGFAETGEAAEEVLAFCRSAQAHYAAAAQAQAEIERIRAESAAAPTAPAPAATGGIACPVCGAANGAGTRFCQSCGAKLETPAAQERACPACGVGVAGGLRFCPACGQKMDE